MKSQRPKNLMKKKINKDKHYYFRDNTNKEWKFLEIRGSNQTCYFKYSTG